jgi:glycosyltransferase involved in cell wall biosynthesis
LCDKGLVFLRIAINTRFLLPGRLEGFGWYTHELVRRMVLAHPEDEFIFFFDRPFEDTYVYGKNVLPLRVPPPARHPFLFYLWFEWALPPLLKKHKVDVFFSPDSFLSLSTPVPTLLACHDLVPLHHPEQLKLRDRIYWTRFLPKFLKKAEQIVTVSQYTAQDIAQTLEVDAAKIAVAYNGARKIFQPLPQVEQAVVRNQYARGEAYFLYAGAIHPRKNIVRLIQAFDAFKKQSNSRTKLLLAGRFAWKTNEVTAAYKASPYSQDIVFTDYVPDSELARLYAAALALTYISLSEGFGLPMVEAMYCDVPVLAANSTCLPEVAGDAALLVDPLSVEAIAGAMLRLSDDAPLRAELIDKGRLRREAFSWDKAAEQVYLLLKKTAGQ